MDFEKDRPIYLQIADYMQEQILQEHWRASNRIPSVRDMAAEVGVNPNTVARSFTHLQDMDLIYNERGIGYFVAPAATDKIREIRRKSFVETQLPELFRNMEMLQISLQDLIQFYEKYKIKMEQ